MFATPASLRRQLYVGPYHALVTHPKEVLIPEPKFRPSENRLWRYLARNCIFWMPRTKSVAIHISLQFSENILATRIRRRHPFKVVNAPKFRMDFTNLWKNCLRSQFPSEGALRTEQRSCNVIRCPSRLGNILLRNHHGAFPSFLSPCCTLCFEVHHYSRRLLQLIGGWFYTNFLLDGVQTGGHDLWDGGVSWISIVRSVHRTYMLI